MFEASTVLLESRRFKRMTGVRVVLPEAPKIKSEWSGELDQLNSIVRIRFSNNKYFSLYIKWMFQVLSTEKICVFTVLRFFFSFSDKGIH